MVEKQKKNLLIYIICIYEQQDNNDDANEKIFFENFVSGILPVCASALEQQQQQKMFKIATVSK